MGGKKVPMNRHAAAAADRKAEAAAKASAAKQQAEEDALWADEGGKASKAKQKAEKAREKAAKKDEVKAMMKEEEAGLQSKGDAPKKVTRYQIQKDLSKQATQNIKKGPANIVTEEQRAKDIKFENQNRKEGEDVAASGLKSAVEQLDKVNFKADTGDKTSNLKAAHMAFEEKMMPQLKTDNPGLKRSQLKEMCFKLWQKSPENPIVREAMQRHAAMQNN